MPALPVAARFSLLATLGLAACARPAAPAEPAPAPAPAETVSATTLPAADVSLPVARVYKSATCGCCRMWVDHLRSEGFAVEVTDTPDLAAIKTRLGVPAGLGSCHTARIGAYTIEGHVPAADIKRLLAQHPAGVAGLAVPGMPTGSPGMEMPGQPAQPYNVVAFGPDGEAVFARH